MNTKMLLGNEAIGLALVEQNCRVVTSYPGTPSSEILPGVLKFKKLFNRDMYVEWSTNEKVAFEIALAASWSGLSSAVAMKQAGLNVAADALFNAAYTGVKGSFIIISADDPGPVSSQTEQDSRLMALNAKVPVFDPSSPIEAREMIGKAMEISARYQSPVMLRPITRLCHAVQNFSITNEFLSKVDEPCEFTKDPARWTATPKFRYLLHVELNRKLLEIEKEFLNSSFNYVVNSEATKKIGIIASGVAFHTVQQVLSELEVTLPILKIGTVYPLPLELVKNFISNYETLIVLEEPGICLELQLPDRRNTRGRLDGTVPNAGELTPEVVAEVLRKVLSAAGFKMKGLADRREMQEAINQLPLASRAPSLCPGCSHRSVFFALKREFGTNAIYPGDIGCLSLGLNLKTVDTFLDMGASISMAEGFYQANRLTNKNTPIIATIGDSTFIHAGIPPLINAVHTDARFVLLILDNHVVAMTGFQPTSGSGILTDGSHAARKISLLELVSACGVNFVKEVDPYDQPKFREALRSAFDFSQAPMGGIAVVVANHACILKCPTAARMPATCSDEGKSN